MGRNSCSRPKIGHFSTKNPPEIPLLEQQSLRKKREHQQAEQTLPLLPRIPSPPKREKPSPNSRQNVELGGKEGGEEVLFTFELGKPKGKQRSQCWSSHPDELTWQQKQAPIPNWGRKRGKRRDPAGFGNPPASDKHAQFQQNLGKGRLGWSLPSPQPGSQRDGGVVVDLNQGKRGKNNK